MTSNQTMGLTTFTIAAFDGLKTKDAKQSDVQLGAKRASGAIGAYTNCGRRPTRSSQSEIKRLGA